MVNETINQRISRLSTEYTDGTRNQIYKPVLIKELEALVVAANIQAIKEMSKKI